MKKLSIILLLLVVSACGSQLSMTDQATENQSILQEITVYADNEVSTSNAYSLNCATRDPEDPSQCSEAAWAVVLKDAAQSNCDMSTVTCTPIRGNCKGVNRYCKYLK